MFFIPCLVILSFVNFVGGFLAPTTLTTRHTINLTDFTLGPYTNGSSQPATVVPTQDAYFSGHLDSAAAQWPSDASNFDEYIVKLNHVTDPTTCATSPVAFKIYHSVYSPFAFISTGFRWPNGATSMAGDSTPYPYYGICFHLGTPNVPDILISADTTTKQVFQVIGDEAPTISLSTNTVAYGQSVVVTGMNWKYYHQVPNEGFGLNLSAGAYTTSLFYQPVAPDDNGYFTVTIPIVQHESPGQYWVTVGDQSNYFEQYSMLTGNPLPLQILSSATPVPSQPTPTSIAQPGITATATTVTTPSTATTPTSIPTITATATIDSAGTQPRSKSESNNSFLLGALGLLGLLSIGGIGWYAWRRQASKTSNKPDLTPNDVTIGSDS